MLERLVGGFVGRRVRRREEGGGLHIGVLRIEFRVALGLSGDPFLARQKEFTFYRPAVSSPALDVRLLTALQVLQVLPQPLQGHD